MLSKDTFSVIMPVHNQENLITLALHSIINNISENVKEIIIILDGCTDNSEEMLNDILEDFPFPPIILHAPNIFEVKATNLGFKTATCEYSIFIQDDMVMTEKDFDKRLLKPYKVIPNLLGITCRDAHDVIPHATDPNMIDYINRSGKDVNTPRNIFAIRDGFNRGPICFNNKKAEVLNYMDEIFAPQNLDDIDIGLRGYKEHGWVVGSWECTYVSELHWGTSRKNMNSYLIFEASHAKNHKIIRERYGDYLLKEKHDEDVIIE